MQYYVVAPDGQKYGPADVMTLNQWAQQNRVTPGTLLEDASNGAQIPASSVPGIIFTAAPPSNQNPYASPPAYQQYPRGGAFGGDNGDGDVKKAWIFGTLGLLCCPIVFSSAGIYFASQGISKGHPQAKSAQIYCIVTLIAGFVLGAMLQGAMGSFR